MVSYKLPHWDGVYYWKGYPKTGLLILLTGIIIGF
jgi:hypothetical protein